MDDDARRHDGYYRSPDTLFYATPGTNVRVRRHLRVGAPPRRAPPYSEPEPDDSYRSTATWEAPQTTASYLRTSREARARVAAASEAIAALPEVTAAGHGEEEECAICLKDFRAGESLRAMPCSHAFHRQCITEWLGRNAVCPLCRHPLPTAALTITTEEEEDELEADSEEEDGGGSG